MVPVHTCIPLSPTGLLVPEDGEHGGAVVVLEHALVVVPQRELVARVDQELVRDARVADVVRQGRDEAGEHVEVRHVLHAPDGLAEEIEGLCT